MTDIKWEAPPASSRKQNRWSEVAAELRQYPGEWALISESYAAGLGTRINQGQGPWGPPGAFQSRAIRIDPSSLRQKVWARYVGEPAR